MRVECMLGLVARRHKEVALTAGPWRMGWICQVDWEELQKKQPEPEIGGIRALWGVVRRSCTQCLRESWRKCWKGKLSLPVKEFKPKVNRVKGFW